MFEVKRIAADLLFHLKSQILHTFEKKIRGNSGKCTSGRFRQRKWHN